MKYEEAVSQVLAIPRYKKKTSQEGILRLLERLGNPQLNLRMIHVAGTNGKGSVCAFLEQIGEDQGYRMGMFTSPHLLDIRERFMINRQMMSKEAFVECYEKVIGVERSLVQEGFAPSTFFEIIFAMAMCYFASQNLDYVIVEAGMGGRSDMTNCIIPVLSIIVSVGLDHTAVLGDTIEKIAYEKAGIIKSNVPVVCSKQSESIRRIISQVAKEKGADCYFIDDYDIQLCKKTAQGIDFSVQNRYDNKSLFHVCMCGLYQVDNAATAIIAAQLLFQKEMTAFADSISRTRWAGRMELVKPGIYVDGAHNPQAMIRFKETVQQCFQDYDEKIIVYAVASDKDDEHMLKEILQIHPSTMIITELANSRKTDGAEVAKSLQEVTVKYQLPNVNEVIYEPDISKAMKKAQKNQNENSIIFCVGSLYLVSDIKALLKETDSDNE